MAETNLNIRIKLTDSYAGAFDKLNNKMQSIANTGEQVGRRMRMLGREINQVGMTMTYFGGAITGPLVLAFKNMEKYSLAVTDKLERLNSVSNRFQISISRAMIPVVEQFTNILTRMLNAWNSLSPATQQAIVQTVLLGGVFLTLGGLLTVVVGKLIAMTGVLIKIGSALGAFLLLNPELMAIIALIVTIIVLMEKWMGTTKMLNTIEKFVRYVALGYESVAQGIARVIEFTGKLTRNKDLEKWGSEQVAQIDQIMQSIADGITRINETGKGSLSGVADQIKTILDSLKGLGLGDTNVKFDPIIKNMEILVGVAQQTAQAMSNSFGQLFFNVMTGNFDDLESVVIDFGETLLSILSQAIAKMILVNTIGAAFPALGKFFHTGGLVRAHTGYLASDERQIVVQTGEGIISRRGMDSLGERNLNRINRGEGVGGATVNVNNSPVVVFKAFNASDLSKNKETIIGMVAESLQRNNRTLRDALKEYA